MDRLSDTKTKDTIYTAEQEHMRNGNYSAAAAILSEALRTFPNDEGLMSELAMALALDGESTELNQAINLCERILFGRQNEKVYHTTRAALSFTYLKAGEKEKAITVAKKSASHSRKPGKYPCGVGGRTDSKRY